MNIDGVLVLAHSDKQDATATWKKTFGHHPLVALVDHSPAGSGEPVAALLRPGNVGDQDPDHMRTSLLPTDSMAAILAVQRLIRPVPPADEEHSLFLQPKETWVLLKPLGGATVRPARPDAGDRRWLQPLPEPA
ncbi:hypothetical protein SALBM311S_12400 [Streptomyces alboniger]